MIGNSGMLVSDSNNVALMVMMIILALFPDVLFGLSRILYLLQALLPHLRKSDIFLHYL